jgi:hypothetical protein
MRVSVTAVNTEVTMPIISTMAKPLTGPEPNQEHQHGGDHVGDIGVKDRAAGFLVAISTAWMTLRPACAPRGCVR